MSVKINVYVEDISDDIIPLWLQGLETCGMHCEIHPKFSFRDHSGFLPFKVEFKRKELPTLGGKTLLSGFELDLADFDFVEVEEEFRELPSFTPDVRRRLCAARKDLEFCWGGNELELILADFSGAILAKLLDGVLFDPQSGELYSNDGIVERVELEIFGDSKIIMLSESDVHPFTGWDV